MFTTAATYWVPHTEVFKEMKRIYDNQACRGSRHWNICGQAVCSRGWMRLMGIGKHRFHVLVTAARDPKCDVCPFDLRFTPKGPKTFSRKRELVHGFLLDLYDQVAESIPDGLNSNKRPRRDTLKVDPADLNRETIKHLPAASICDFWRQCKAALKDDTVSLKLFSSEPCFTFSKLFLPLEPCEESCKYKNKQCIYNIYLETPNVLKFLPFLKTAILQPFGLENAFRRILDFQGTFRRNWFWRSLVCF